MQISVPTALAYSLLGFSIVFAGLVFLMIVIKVMTAIMGTGKQKEAPAAVSAAPAAPAAPAVSAPVASGTAGEIKLFDVPDKEAAMIMAIVADKMQRPLNELRFKSIKEVK